jgi:hypothetical protein
MSDRGKQRKLFEHSADWHADHARLLDEPETGEHLKFDGLIVDLEGRLREQRRCPACQSTLSGPPTTMRLVLVGLREQFQKLGASFDILIDSYSPATTLRR